MSAPVGAIPAPRPRLLLRVVLPLVIVLAGLAFSLWRAGLFSPGEGQTAANGPALRAPARIATPPPPVTTPLPAR